MAARGARKCMQPKHIFATPGTTQFWQSKQFSLSLRAYKVYIEPQISVGSLPYDKRICQFMCVKPLLIICARPLNLADMCILRSGVKC